MKQTSSFAKHPTPLLHPMKHLLTLIITIFCCLTTIQPTMAEQVNSNKEVEAAINQFSQSIQELNDILSKVTDRESADAAAIPTRNKTRELYLNLRAVQNLTPQNTANDEETVKLTNQVLELQLMQATFEQQCLRIAGNNFYESVALARVFQSLANVYKQEQPTNTQPAAQPAPEEQYTPEQLRRIEEHKKHESRRAERLKLYQN